MNKCQNSYFFFKKTIFFKNCFNFTKIKLSKEQYSENLENHISKIEQNSIFFKNLNISEIKQKDDSFSSDFSELKFVNTNISNLDILSSNQENLNKKFDDLKIMFEQLKKYNPELSNYEINNKTLKQDASFLENIKEFKSNLDVVDDSYKNFINNIKENFLNIEKKSNNILDFLNDYKDFNNNLLKNMKKLNLDLNTYFFKKIDILKNFENSIQNLKKDFSIKLDFLKEKLTIDLTNQNKKIEIILNNKQENLNKMKIHNNIELNNWKSDILSIFNNKFFSWILEQKSCLFVLGLCVLLPIAIKFNLLSIIKNGFLVTTSFVSSAMKFCFDATKTVFNKPQLESLKFLKKKNFNLEINVKTLATGIAAGCYVGFSFFRKNFKHCWSTIKFV